ncbi:MULTISPECIES: sigma-70 family RNA polymerase sigma factor [Arcicella]|uniref:Sigma-70 family RNA polymerase sigma factor n=1 Tax=Arcicella aquatica TaxID=217141 RepID=A0ABU5QLQ8_9BACT|nr:MULTISPECIES: sigma-70 family RNA polymerase sigma factor [Arcicella]MDR6562430.1 RNA polymerase sigma factor (sigma-70 family) [Arcicella sp. BE51]MDR6812324.1 RNA polymerase sigma factor (sigma-70 family) [Arcicella sp. BE140]MDR6823655.1 RNA polymerase sigma factor (sigma-70 family) [Arcicella sp. BE139]MEA5257997.1 sigma-70 family RNA polymerase sigma factor [Arcicella aquatica]
MKVDEENIKPLIEGSLDAKATNLWLKIKAGDESAYEELMIYFYKILFNYGVRLVPEEDYVKDCIQDVFLEIWLRRSTLGDTDYVKYYLLKSLRRRIFREYKKWFSQQEEASDDYNFIVDFSIEAQLIEQESTTEQVEKIEMLLNKLPKRQKEVVYLKFYQNLNNEQISEVLGVNRQSVYNLLYEALRKLRNEWTGEYINLLVLLSTWYSIK